MDKGKIRLYDTYQGMIRPFKPIKDNEVDIYYCGPTVYNYVHLGNMRPAITFDLLSNFLSEVGYDVKLVSNYTDIDDKIIAESIKEGKSEKELSLFYIKAYEDCLNKLKISPLYYHPKASEYIDKMVDFIDDLIKDGKAYKAGNDIYFRVHSVPSYGKLSNQNLEELEAGKRIDVASGKEDPLDFVLWKLTDDQGIKFDTKIGLGRPGWHTECVCMVDDVFSSPLIDIHGGGFDLKFPHHENEIAQSLAHNNTTLANYWMHVGFLMTGGEKMSKSLGNSILAIDVLSRHLGEAVRLFFYQTNYRSPINYSEEILEECDKKINKYISSIRRASVSLDYNNIKTDDVYDQEIYEELLEALADDLNTANALAVFDKAFKMLNSVANSKNLDKLNTTLNTIIKMSNVLGFKFNKYSLTDEERKLLDDYNKARSEKDYSKSDSLRAKLLEKNLI